IDILREGAATNTFICCSCSACQEKISIGMYPTAECPVGRYVEFKVRIGEDAELKERQQDIVEVSGHLHICTTAILADRSRDQSLTASKARESREIAIPSLYGDRRPRREIANRGCIWITDIDNAEGTRIAYPAQVKDICAGSEFPRVRRVAAAIGRTVHI